MKAVTFAFMLQFFGYGGAGDNFIDDGFTVSVTQLRHNDAQYHIQKGAFFNLPDAPGFREVELKHGNLFGWGLYIDSELPTIKLKQVLIENMGELHEKRQERTDLHVIRNQLVGGDWSINKSDRVGKYKFEIYHFEDLVYEVEFKVVAKGGKREQLEKKEEAKGIERKNAQSKAN